MCGTLARELTVYEKKYIMILWLLYQYVSPMGRKAIDDWRKRDLAIGGPRVDLDVFLKNLVKQREWEYPDRGYLKGDRYRGLTELRWKSGGKPHRIFGYELREFEYLMLVGCTHNKRKYDPPDAMETARRRRREIEEGRATYREYQLITDA